jgi:uncharacterized protein YndB with AHSA1/START domain
MSKERSFTVTRTVPAKAGDVYRMFTNSTHIREWLSDVAVSSPHPGGRIMLGWDDGYAMVGNYSSTEAEKKVGFSWLGSADPGLTQVVVTLKPIDGETRVKVVQSGFGSGKKWARARSSMKKAWERSLENLESVLATGHDLRFTMRPMLGISVGEVIDADSAAREGLDRSYGLRLSGIVPGMGAEAAGLQSNDIIIAIDQEDLTGWGALVNVLSKHRAGDRVVVSYLRDGIHGSSEMVLSGRPLPPVPASAPELAEFTGKLFERWDNELASLFQGVNEEEASHKPGPDEWSAKEVIAHLLNDRGDQHSWIAELVQGNERSFDGGFANSHLRTAVTANSYDSVGSMLAALSHLQGQTIGLLAGLPEEFVAQKPTFWRLAYGFTQEDSHLEEHLAQMKEAIDSARRAQPVRLEASVPPPG